MTSLSTPPAMRELLRLAGVPASSRGAATWLENAIASAKTSYKAAKQRPHPADHNALLVDIEKSAKQLSKRIHRLRQHLVSWHAFWRSKAFGPVHVDRIAAPEVFSMLEKVVNAADASKDRGATGRRREAGKQHVVDRALGFFVRFSPFEPSGTATGPFAQFAREFYSAVTEVAPEKHRGLDRQIREAVKRLPIERKRPRAQRKSVK